jgi:deoxycytidylate deaminase
MSLDNFYKLRHNFIILGLTGKMQSGADQIVKLLSQDCLSEEQKEFLRKFQAEYKFISQSESRKVRRIVDFFEFAENWIKFEVIDYRNVVLLFVLHQNYDKDQKVFVDNICNWILRLGKYKEFITPRIGSEKGISIGSTDYINTEFRNEITEAITKFNIDLKTNDTLLEVLKKLEDDFSPQLGFFFSEEFKSLGRVFYESLDRFSPFLRHKFVHIISYCLRRFGTLDLSVIKDDPEKDNLEHIYIVADVINRLIKIFRKINGNQARIIIDRLKNSYELMYFREKYSGFYMITSSRDEKDRLNLIKEKLKRISIRTSSEDNFRLLTKLDETEYLIDEFKNGEFDSFDIENCVQKSDYHVVIRNNFEFDEIIENCKETAKQQSEKKIDRTNEVYVYQPVIIQILRLIALIQQPGLVTPTYIERIMQSAYNAKLNSGCISRQVGAVVTDGHFSVKGIGWNDVPDGQTSCANRDLRDLVDNSDDSFTNLEMGLTDHKYIDGKSFNEKINSDFNQKRSSLDQSLKGRPCSFCFKSFHNSYEAKENQVHTRSLHAEENAMLQIAKFGGQPLKGGNLFTTASPCELCSKKAYQLGVKNIFYIDLYPGISKNQILEGGKSNPVVYPFQGAIGKSYQKLFEPFMSIKDETILRSGIKPTVTEKEKVIQLKKILKDELEKEENKLVMDELDKLKDQTDILEKIVSLLKNGIKSPNNEAH